jgi:hypothetical protein
MLALAATTSSATLLATSSTRTHARAANHECVHSSRATACNFERLRYMLCCHDIFRVTSRNDVTRSTRTHAPAATASPAAGRQLQSQRHSDVCPCGHDICSIAPCNPLDSDTRPSGHCVHSSSMATASISSRLRSMPLLPLHPRHSTLQPARRSTLATRRALGCTPARRHGNNPRTYTPLLPLLPWRHSLHPSGRPSDAQCHSLQRRQQARQDHLQAQ